MENLHSCFLSHLTEEINKTNPLSLILTLLLPLKIPNNFNQFDTFICPCILDEIFPIESEWNEINF